MVSISMLFRFREQWKIDEQAFEVSEGIDNLLKPTTRQSRDKKSFHLGETEIIDLLSRKEK